MIPTVYAISVSSILFLTVLHMLSQKMCSIFGNLLDDIIRCEADRYRSVEDHLLTLSPVKPAEIKISYRKLLL